MQIMRLSLKKDAKDELAGSVFARRLPRVWVEVIFDCVMELTVNFWVVDCLFTFL